MDAPSESLPKCFKSGDKPYLRYTSSSHYQDCVSVIMLLVILVLSEILKCNLAVMYGDGDGGSGGHRV